ncbi:uncharacterized protein BDZ99DRAFT_282905 [Mytilinidion resinicola]|uniref:MFS general substrate transporter n=1 Tax=Mytilinidion resinicola TaxID=574789 RepID=A0A6A6YSL0_9PEZI|nr:uncharacterized protein BDZ99DRAFT_282905 [Mytilinidion resinicola]KAF2811912.1 hypothetical protein BDZ99DRAFT_282905 [Mytilinidion resinicola]
MPLEPLLTVVSIKQRRSQSRGLVFVIAQAGGTIFPGLAGLVAGKAGVSVLQPILIALIVAMGISWVMIPRVEQKKE